MYVPSSFIVLYGTNHVQKFMQARRLVDFLQQKGGRAEYIKYPIYSLAPSGFYIRQALRAKMKISEAELQLWCTLNRFQYQPILQRKLEEGITIVAEDYVGTALAWGPAKGAQRDWIEKINAPLLRENVSILIDTSTFASSDEEQAPADNILQERVRQNLLELARERGWLVVDGNRATERVFEDLVKALERVK